MRHSALVILVLALVGLPSLLMPSATVAQSATPAVACTATDAEQNKEAVNQFLAAINSGDDDAAAALTAEGLTYHSRAKGDRQGDAGGFLQGQQASFPDTTMTVDLLVADGDAVAAYVSWSGTLEGESAKISGQDVSVPGGQRDAEWVGSLFFQFECGKIAHVWPVIDRLGHLMALGVISQEDLQGAESATPVP